MTFELRDSGFVFLKYFLSMGRINRNDVWKVYRTLNVSLTPALQSWVITLYDNLWEHSEIKSLVRLSIVVMVMVEKRGGFHCAPTLRLVQGFKPAPIWRQGFPKVTTPSCLCAFITSALRSMQAVHRNILVNSNAHIWFIVTLMSSTMTASCRQTVEQQTTDKIDQSARQRQFT